MDADRKLLELAAKAAGVGLLDWRELWADYTGPAWRTVERELWNPLTNDGDALRLATACGLVVIPYPFYKRPKHSVVVKRYEEGLAVYRGEVTPVEVIEPYGADPNAATRRAIVRAAAEIGRAMPATPPPG